MFFFIISDQIGKIDPVDQTILPNLTQENFVFDSENKVEYLGFRYLWTDLLYLISVLRYNAGYVVLDALDQANLYILEYNCKKALFEYDPQGAQQIKNFIG